MAIWVVVQLGLAISAGLSGRISALPAGAVNAGLLSGRPDGFAWPAPWAATFGCVGTTGVVVAKRARLFV